MGVLQNFDQQEFLREYWQRKPLLLENALPGFCNPLCADELAGLALEPEVESRLVECLDNQWRLQHGPFQQDSFDRDCPWTLLVQAVDHWVPAVAQLRQLVQFLPSWRIDDVMVSYANEGGGVGPHYDNYDVFLLQGQGQREWRIGQFCGAEDSLIAHEELRILSQFEERARYTLSPGDILYIPPRCAHWGIALGDCMTYSIGFRAPRLNDLLSRWTDHTLEALDAEEFYRDPPSMPEQRPGEISEAALAEALTRIEGLLQQQALQPHWFGELVTEPRNPLPEAKCSDAFFRCHSVTLVSEAKLAWCIIDAQLTVFANGVSLEADTSCQPWLESLCGGQPLLQAQLAEIAGNGAHRQLLEKLLQHGCIYGE